MRRILLLLCVLATAGLWGTASAYVTTCGSDRIESYAEATVSYAGIRAWAAIRNNETTTCLVRLVKRYNYRLDSHQTLTVIDAILTSAITYDLDPLFIASVIAAESSFNPRARSYCGAEGLMQLTRPIQPWLGVRDPYDIKDNVVGGCQYLTYLKERFHRPELVLAAYNAGPGRVARLGRVPAIPETVTYVDRVISLHHRLKTEVSQTLAGRLEAQDPFGFA